MSCGMKCIHDGMSRHFRLKNTPKLDLKHRCSPCGARVLVDLDH